MKKTLTLIATAGLLALAGAAQAGQKVTVEKNHVVRVSLGGTAGSVIVGNPDIADVNVIDSHTIYIIGKGFGNSAITVTGRDGRPLFDGNILVTSSQNGAVTVYKGLKPSLMVCSNICIAEDANSGNAYMAPSISVPGGLTSMGPTVSSGASAVGSAVGGVSGTAMQAQ